MSVTGFHASFGPWLKSQHPVHFFPTLCSLVVFAARLAVRWLCAHLLCPLDHPDVSLGSEIHKAWKKCFADEQGRASLRKSMPFCFFSLPNLCRLQRSNKACAMRQAVKKGKKRNDSMQRVKLIVSDAFMGAFRTNLVVQK